LERVVKTHVSFFAHNAFNFLAMTGQAAKLTIAREIPHQNSANEIADIEGVAI